MASIELSGFDELENLLSDMTIDEADSKKAMKNAIEVLADEIERNTPEGSTGNLKKLKTKISKDGLAIKGTVKLGAFYGMFQEFGTSKSKSHVGFFERSVNSKKDNAINVLANELLNR